MPEKFIILRSVKEPAHRVTAVSGRQLKKSTTPARRTNFKVEVEAISKKKALQTQKHKEVVSVTPVMPMKLIRPLNKKVPTHRKDGKTTWGVKAVAADTSPYTGKGITVAVLDTGIHENHPAFKGVKFITKDYTSEGVKDKDGHGTHCAGTIFGRNVDGMRIGVAPGVVNALIGKVIGEKGGGSDLIAAAINWAVENGAHVISMSLGIDFPGYVKELSDEGMPVDVATSKALEGYRANVTLFEKLAGYIKALGSGSFRQPSILLAAAGNESMRDEYEQYEIAVSPPAVSDGFISVGAAGDDPGGWIVAPFSNTGPMICGPGVDILSSDLNKGLESLSGTSMATPHVAGVAALWAEHFMQRRVLNNTQLLTTLLSKATHKGFKRGVDLNTIGAGMVQAPQK